MAGGGAGRGLAACFLAGSLFLFAVPRNSRLDGSAFVAGRQAAVEPRALAETLCGSSGSRDCGREASLVAMRSQGQGGRDLYGQRQLHGKPRLKANKMKSRGRVRKTYGSRSARQLPRRYPLYDILEEIHETVPTYTVISEPEEPLEPVLGVELTKRYPWAGSLDKVNKKKQEMEHGTNDERMEPYFGSWTGAGLKPQGRMQLYIKRMGFPSYNYPPWVNRPLDGEQVKVPGDLAWSKHRTPELWQYTPQKRKAILAERGETEEDEDDDDSDDPLEDFD
eukprot:TRINITY_DN1477_c0_g1_i1.p1 TRINITY_DN1477_c0_g1~~TRINITY_DN1477_c0_g1_i1.p1  ORF type:complete len:296 (-),score=70.66 TRINITY_DN1477_c0_g1_i1:125-961(-)